MRRIIQGYVFGVLVLVGLSAMAGEVQTVEVRGEAAIIDGDKASARDKAIDDALRKAVESAVGTIISSETITENYQLISDRIYSKAEGYVRKYKITDEREDDGVMIVEVRAEVATGAVSKDLEGLKTLLRRKKMPRVLVLIAEQNIGMNRPKFWWGQIGKDHVVMASQEPVSLDLSTVENTLMGVMKEKGFDFIDTQTLSGKIKVRIPVSKLSEKQAMRIASATDAEIAIVGQAVAKKKADHVLGTDMISVGAIVNAKVINTDNGRIIATASAQAANVELDAKIAGNNALKKAGEKLAKKLMEKIAKVWSSELSGINRIRVSVSGIKNQAQLSDFTKVLKNRVRSVKDVRQYKLSSGHAELEVDLAGDSQALATELEAKDFGGQFKLEIVKVRPNAIGVKLIQ